MYNCYLLKKTVRSLKQRAMSYSGIIVPCCNECSTWYVLFQRFPQLELISWVSAILSGWMLFIQLLKHLSQLFLPVILWTLVESLFHLIHLLSLWVPKIALFVKRIEQQLLIKSLLNLNFVQYCSIPYCPLFEEPTFPQSKMIIPEELMLP